MIASTKIKTKAIFSRMLKTSSPALFDRSTLHKVIASSSPESIEPPLLVIKAHWSFSHLKLTESLTTVEWLVVDVLQASYCPFSNGPLPNSVFSKGTSRETSTMKRAGGLKSKSAPNSILSFSFTSSAILCTDSWALAHWREPSFWANWASFFKTESCTV